MSVERSRGSSGHVLLPQQSANAWVSAAALREGDKAAAICGRLSDRSRGD